jgi:murein endopeptidase
MLPPSEHYTIRFPEMAYGTTITIRGIRRALAGFRRDTGFSREITIGAISLAKGRKLPPHKSHQSGRDVDVRLPAMPHALETGPMRSDQVDWYATWALLEAFVRTGDVQVMFLEKRTHKHVRRAAMRLGASDEYIEQVFSFVTHQSGHGSHIHVRFRCSEQASSCRG